MALNDYWEAAKAAVSAFKDSKELTRQTRQAAEAQVGRWDAARDVQQPLRDTRQEAKEQVDRWEAAADARRQQRADKGLDLTTEMMRSTRRELDIEPVRETGRQAGLER